MLTQDIVGRKAVDRAEARMARALRIAPTSAHSRGGTSHNHLIGSFRSNVHGPQSHAASNGHCTALVLAADGEAISEVDILEVLGP